MALGMAAEIGTARKSINRTGFAACSIFGLRPGVIIL